MTQKSNNKKISTHFICVKFSPPRNLLCRESK